MKETSEQFVNVRLVKCNGLDLEQFQFDPDLTFAAFFLNADGTLYARYGIRTSKEADDDVSLDGLAATMRRVLELHSDFPNNRDQLLAKQAHSGSNDDSKFRVPEDYSALDHFKGELNYEKQVAKSCIHCHQLGDAQRFELRQKSLPFPVKLLYPFPSPSTIGIAFDLDTCATIKSLIDDRIGANSGLKVGDQVLAISNQAIASPADVVWALHNSADGDTLRFEVRRGSTERVKVDVKLPDGWRKTTDISWRPTTWQLRGMVTGGAVLEALDPARKKAMGLGVDQTSLRIKHLGRYNDHARALKAGAKVNDILIAVDGRDDFLSEAAVIEYAIQEKKPGDLMTFTLRRNEREIKATIKLK